jgi:hypothetical protein
MKQTGRDSRFGIALVVHLFWRSAGTSVARSICMHGLPDVVQSLLLFLTVASAFFAMLMAVAPRTHEHRYHRWHVHDQRRKF